VHKEDEVVHPGELFFRVFTNQVRVPEPNLQMPCDGDVPASIDSAPLPNEMGDAVGKQLHVVPAIQFHVLVGRVYGLKVGHELVNFTANLVRTEGTCRVTRRN
jgi:hypothetical protein